MNSHLERYLNDHLAGSSGAVDLIAKLAEASDDPAQSDFFRELGLKVESDREFLKSLLKKIGQRDSAILQIAGSLTEKAGRLKLLWEGLEPGKLGMFEALEMLCLGIQGKRLLWRVLGKISPRIPEWSEIDFTALELEAVRQRDAVEAYRVQAGISALVDGERGNGQG
ncbi:MAG: hypothetical protein QM627_09245 [Luteolibacter sp.]